jgi:hypothetical protein
VSDQGKTQVSVETLKQLYDTLLELRQATKQLESEEVAEALTKKFEQLDNIMKSVNDFIHQEMRAWWVRYSDYDEVEISYIYEPDVATYIKADSSWKLVDVYNKFFSEAVFINKIITLMIRTISEITDLIGRNSDIYMKIARLDGRIDRLYEDIRKLCPQQDP